jgi:hypothetical protein
MVVSNWSFPWLFQSSFLFRSMRRGREGTSSSDLVTAGTESTVFAPVVSFGFVSQNKSNKHFMVLGCFIDILWSFFELVQLVSSCLPCHPSCLFFFRVLSGSVSAFWQLDAAPAFSHRLKPWSPFYLDCLDVVCSVCLLTTCLPFVSLLVSAFISLRAFLVFILVSPCPCLDF